MVCLCHRFPSSAQHGVKYLNFPQVSHTVQLLYLSCVVLNIILIPLVSIEIKCFTQMSVRAPYSAPSSYLQWSRGTAGPGVFQTGLHLLRLQSLRVHAFQSCTSMLGFAVVLSNHWCAASGTQMTNDDGEDKNKTMRKETRNMGGAESDGELLLDSENNPKLM